MNRREQWEAVLAAEVERWSAKRWSSILADLRDGCNIAYEVVKDSKTFQVEVDLLENTPEYLNISVAVDDGSLPQSIHPASRSFLCPKGQ